MIYILLMAGYLLFGALFSFGVIIRNAQSIWVGPLYVFIIGTLIWPVWVVHDLIVKH